jgi:hypothetical protein
MFLGGNNIDVKFLFGNIFAEIFCKSILQGKKACGQGRKQPGAGSSFDKCTTRSPSLGTMCGSFIQLIA